MENELKNIFLNHKGKISDKWELYIGEWDKIFSSFQVKPLNILEIGVHNGGSLEIWAEYFQNARKIIGCDINKACKELIFDDPRISIVIGDVKADEVKSAILTSAKKFDIIIDDGSHSSRDIVCTFAKYYNLLNPGGLYIIEDLHASYWEEYGGGLHYPFSAMSFFKRLVDIPNFEHWRNNQSYREFFSPYALHYSIDFDNLDFNSIHKIEFLNSLCIVHRNYPKENVLGNRMIVGKIGTVSNDWANLDSSTIHQIPTHISDYQKYDVFSLIKSNQELIIEANDLKESSIRLNSVIQEKGKKIQQLQKINSDKADKIESLQTELDSQEQLNQSYLTKIDLLNVTIQRLETMNNEIARAFRISKKDIEEKVKQIQVLKASLKRKIKDIEKSEQELNLKTLDIEGYLLKLEEFDGIIDQRNAKIAELEEEILSYALKENLRLKFISRKIKRLFKNKTLFKDLFDYFSINRSGLFDIHFYLQRNPDVRKAKIDPLMHFVQHGWKEGRNPNEHFDTKAYISYNPDIDITGINPLIHLIKHGKVNDLPLKKFNFKENQFNYLDLSTHEGRLVAIPFNSNNPPKAPDIIIFPIIDWDFRFQRPQQIARQLAKFGHRVFYIKSTFRNTDAPLIEALNHNIFSVELSSSFPSTGLYSSFSEEHIQALESSIRTIKDYFLINAAIMMVDLPGWERLTTRLKENFSWKLVYDCMDLHRGFSNSNIFTQRDEKRLLQASDLVLASSINLYKHAKEINKQTVLIPNGTDYEFFHQAKNPMEIVEIANTSKPIIGYYGAIANWFDTHLVGELASNHPEWEFLLIGRTDLADLEPLEGLPNLQLLGEKPYSELPGYLSNFDVCIIPFKKSPLTQATNPVKLFEYLSAGKPIVSTHLDEIARYEKYVRLAETTGEWELAIQQSLEENRTTELLNNRFDFAMKNSWKNRAKRIKKAYVKLFPKISIIIPTYDNLDLTKLCLKSIVENTAYPNYEIVIVDNGSKQDTVNYLKKFSSYNSNIKLHLNEKNLGFAKANNQGFNISTGDYLVFLNNDTIVTVGWLHLLSHHLIENKRVGMVGPVTNSIGNEARIDVGYTNIDDVQAFAAQRAKEFSGKNFSIKVLALYCCMISRDLFEELGGLDERYNVAMFEDDDLAIKIRQKGLDLRCAEDVFIHHHHSASLNKLGDEFFQQLFEENKRRFEEKWGIQWEPHRYRD